MEIHKAIRDITFLLPSGMYMCMDEVITGMHEACYIFQHSKSWERKNKEKLSKMCLNCDSSKEGNKGRSRQNQELHFLSTFFHGWWNSEYWHFNKAFQCQKKQQYSGQESTIAVARGTRHPPPPLVQNFFIFVQFSGKIGQIIHPPPFGVSTPSCGKSWIRHCIAWVVYCYS